MIASRVRSPFVVLVVVVVRRGAPHPFAGDAHRAKSETPDRQVAANPERTAFGRWQILAKVCFTAFCLRFLAHGLIPLSVFPRIWSARPFDARVRKIGTNLP